MSRRRPFPRVHPAALPGGYLAAFTFFLPGGAVLPAAVCIASVPAAAAPARPNVLVIVSDDLCTHVGAYGNRVVRTPHFDALAARGVRSARAS